MSIPSPVPGMPAPAPGEGDGVATPPAIVVPPQIVPPPGILGPRPVAVAPSLPSAPWAPLDRPMPEGEPPAATEPDLDRMIVVDRRPLLAWSLVVEGGPTLPLTGTRVVLGRRPDGAGGGAQELAVPDATRTLSKVHARLDLVDGLWTVTDLDATNGVIVAGADGVERLLDPGATAPVVERFVLGRVGIRLVVDGDAAR